MKRARITFSSPDSEQTAIVSADWDDEGDFTMNMKITFEPAIKGDDPGDFHTELAFRFLDFMGSPKNH